MFMYYNTDSCNKNFLEALRDIIQRKTGHWVYRRVFLRELPHCRHLLLTNVHENGLWLGAVVLTAIQKISLKSFHHFIVHEPSYQTSHVFPSKLYGYHVSTRDCEFVFAMRSGL